MKLNTLNINSSKPIVLIPLQEYEYLKSLEEAIKHPERYANIEDPDYLSPEEIVLVYETNRKINEGDYSDFVSLEDVIEKISKKKKRSSKSKDLYVSDKKNVYSKNRKKSSKIS